MTSFTDLIKAYIQDKQAARGIEFSPIPWLDFASKRASQIMFATHVLKFVHGDAKGTNIFFEPSEPSNKLSRYYVATNLGGTLQKDTVGNAAALDVAGLLMLKLDEVLLIDLISKNDSSPFAHFAENDVQLASWMKGFRETLKMGRLSSHTLAKQIYFPVNKEEYHLLAPLYPSSLAHILYTKVKEDRFGEKAKEARGCQKKEISSEDIIFDYPGLAIQTFGGTKPQNVSKLNSMRGGRSFLLRSVPPKWSRVSKPPLTKFRFWDDFGNRAGKTVKAYRDFLVSVEKINNIDIRNRCQNYIDQLLDILVQTSLEIQALNPGWSSNSQIPKHEQLWLDPERADPEFLLERSLNEWMEPISNHFATWLIRKLKHKNSEFGDGEFIEVKNACYEHLKLVSR